MLRPVPRTRKKAMYTFLNYSDDIEMPLPVAFGLFVVLLIGGAYVMAFPGQLARAQLRKKYGHDWENYVDVTKGRLVAIVLGALLVFVLGLVGVVMAGSELFG